MTAPYQPEPIGVDVGNATVTAATATGRTVFFPSFVAQTRRRYEGASKIATTRHHVTYKGVNYIVGADALEIPGHDSLMAEGLSEDKAYERYLSDRSFAAFLAAVSALHPTADVLGVRLGTGAPLSVYEPWADALVRRYVGTHEYEYLGHKRRLIVDSANVYGEGVESPRLLPVDRRMGRVAAHDVGGRTYGVLLFNNGALVRKRAFDNGIDRLFADISIVSTDPGARWAMQQEMRSNPKAHAAVRAELNASLVDSLKNFESKLKLADADLHIVMGGGAVYAAPVIEKRYKKPVIVLNESAPEMVNALAYAKAAADEVL